ncbi:MAG: hypothetical protein PHO32_10640 [Candidatus Cloacimonetes bacterium]|nr:hypothetical protein [Candidatus Cloacimonadota bacterium]
MDLSIFDGYTTLFPQIEVSILGSIQYLIISPSTVPEMNIHLSWNAVGGATHYIVYAGDTPEGAFDPIAWTQDFYIDVNSASERRFFKVTAKNGELPER